MNYLNVKAPWILFQEARNSKVYVDKSMLIGKVSSEMRTSGKYICITRPRRFGKTMNVHMLGAYYTKGLDCAPLFEDLEISRLKCYEEHRNRHNVIYIDFSRMPDGCGSYKDYINSIIKGIKRDLLDAYPVIEGDSYASVGSMFSATGDSFLFLLDEWDSVFYRKFMSRADKDDYLAFLKGLLKDQPYVELAYMTGVLPIAKYSSGSELNMFDAYSFMDDNVYDKYFGFSEDEVKDLCHKFTSVTYEDLSYWYNGYCLSDGRRLFNPRSVSKALARGVCLNYWTETGPMNEIADCIENNTAAVREDIVKMVAGIPVEAELDGYSAAELQMDSRDEILSAMVVYGFLSYHDGCLRIPNRELMEKFQKVLSRESMGEIRQIVEKSREMLEATLDKDAEKVAAMLEEVHDREIPFLQYNDENSLSCVITLCYLYARKDYRIEREAKGGKGYCDYVFIPKKPGKPGILLELKVDDTCGNALRQIREKGYRQKLGGYAKEALLVGISYERGKKRHTCMIEEE